MNVADINTVEHQLLTKAFETSYDGKRLWRLNSTFPFRSGDKIRKQHQTNTSPFAIAHTFQNLRVQLQQSERYKVKASLTGCSVQAAGSSTGAAYVPASQAANSSAAPAVWHLFTGLRPCSYYFMMNVKRAVFRRRPRINDTFTKGEQVKQRRPHLILGRVTVREEWAP